MRPADETIDPVRLPFAGLTSERPAPGLCAGVLALGLCIAFAPGNARAASGESQLEISGLTFIGSRGDGSEVVLRATHALLMPDSQEADLFGVRAEVTHHQGASFTMRCEKAQLNLETNDFSAEGDVNGVTGAGERYTAPWVRYSEQEDLLYTDAPVSMVNESGQYSGDGFRYQIGERRFRLIGHVRVEQTP